MDRWRYKYVGHSSGGDMNESDPSVWGEILKAVATLLGALGLSGWLSKRNMERIDTISESHVPREEFNSMVASLRREQREAREEQAKAAAATHARLDNVLLMLAKKDK